MLGHGRYVIDLAWVVVLIDADRPAINAGRSHFCAPSPSRRHTSRSERPDSGAPVAVRLQCAKNRSVDVVSGDLVNAGQPLFSIGDRNYRARDGTRACYATLKSKMSGSCNPTGQGLEV